MAHVSKGKWTVRGQWIKCTSYAQSPNLPEMCKVLEGLLLEESPFPRSVYFRGLFLNVYGQESWSVLLA